MYRPKRLWPIDRWQNLMFIEYDVNRLSINIEFISNIEFTLKELPSIEEIRNEIASRGHNPNTTNISIIINDEYIYYYPEEHEKDIIDEINKTESIYCRDLKDDWITPDEMYIRYIIE